MGFDVHHIREQFPILKTTMHGKPLVYLDNGATTLKPKAVVDAIDHYYEEKTSNVHRGAYQLSSDATDLYEGARVKVRDFINARTENEVVFTKGATQALNLVAQSWGIHNLKAGDEILCSELEHHSSFLPWQYVARVTGATLKFIPLTEEGRITVENTKSVLTENTKVIAINYVSNVMGYIAPIKEIAALAHSVGAILTVDAAQALPHMKVDVQDLDCDFLSFSAHKMCGPTGTGVLYGKLDLLNVMEPIEFGGEMIDLVGDVTSTWKDAPYRFEAGTPVIAGAIGLGAAIDFIETVGYENIVAQELKLRQHAIAGMKEIDGLTIFNEGAETGIISFNVDGVHPHDMASIYDAEGICVRAGHHCAQPLMKWLCQPATVRASFYFYNTMEDVEAFLAATRQGKEFFSDVFF
ncbi:MAG: cysteine desulfurase [Turicibacter sp.]|nr:cysteine desulfurase [Turicibacter sp.]